jgi:hypothetical protein
MSHKYLLDASPFSTGAFARLLEPCDEAQPAASYHWPIDVEAPNRLLAGEWLPRRAL